MWAGRGVVRRSLGPPCAQGKWYPQDTHEQICRRQLEVWPHRGEEPLSGHLGTAGLECLTPL